MSGTIYRAQLRDGKIHCLTELFRLPVCNTEDMKLRWGIVTTGFISNKFMTALNYLPKDNHQAVAVGARSLNSAKEFAETFGIEKAYGSYEDLAKDPDVDIAYVGIITSLHFQLAKLMLEHGKHVLCEKPLTLNLKQTTELTVLAKNKGLFLMEAIWSRCFPTYKKIEEAISSKVIGDVKFVECNLGIEMGRDLKKANGSTCLLDIGIYNLQIVTLAFGQVKPSKVTAVGTLNDDGVDVAFSVSLKFPNGGLASISASVDTKFPNEAIIYGTKGTIKVHEPFYCASEITIGSEVIEIPSPFSEVKTVLPRSVGLHYEAEEVRQCLIKGLTECPMITLSESRLLASIMDEIRSQLGVVFPADES